MDVYHPPDDHAAGARLVSQIEDVDRLAFVMNGAFGHTRRLDRFGWA